MTKHETNDIITLFVHQLLSNPTILFGSPRIHTLTELATVDVFEASAVLILTQFISSLLCCVGQYKPDLSFFSIITIFAITKQQQHEDNLIKHTFVGCFSFTFSI